MVNPYCRVCGLKQNEPPWTENGGATWNICSACGSEFGLDDCYLFVVRQVRKEWIDNGSRWFRPEEKPENWSLEEQLKNIPPEWV